MSGEKVSQLRQNYTVGQLLESEAPDNPWELFSAWFDAARDSSVLEPNAMNLATVSPQGQPCARIVLLKDFREPDGLFFFTNYLSQKGNHLQTEPRASLLFWWEPLQRQIRIEGHTHKVSEEESDEYFHSRPLESRLGAWVSEQSTVIGGREVLDQRLATFRQQYASGDVPRPPHWGGYRLEPQFFEFWQGRPSRLHDRLCYRKESGRWIQQRLAP